MLTRSLPITPLLASCVLLTATHNAIAQAPIMEGEPPTLVLAIVVDQMRFDYLTRYGNEFNGGLQRLIEEGAVFTNAHYEAAPSVTAVGHSTFLSGAVPAVSGIAGNLYYSRADGRPVQSITDRNATPLGNTSGASPHRMLVTTVGDELKASGKGGKVFGVSLKDRSAILPAGRGADGAFWVGDSGDFASSNWYFPELPAWVNDFNSSKPSDSYAGVEWLGVQLPATPGTEFYEELDKTPYSDQMVLDFAERLMEEENLGDDALTDLLSVSFSATDYQGHANGIETEMMRAMMLSIDEKIGQLLKTAQRHAGRGRLLVVLTADHGVSPAPEENNARRLPGGRYAAQDERDAVNAALVAAFGEGDYIEGNAEMSMYFARDPVPGKHIPRSEMERVAVETLRAMPQVARVYTRTELESPLFAGDRIDQRVRNGFSRITSGDVIVVHEPNWMNRPAGTTHGSPYSYDTHVPMIFWGPETLVTPGRYHQDAAVHDIAPTLSTMLQIARPSGAMGRVLHEILSE